MTTDLRRTLLLALPLLVTVVAGCSQGTSPSASHSPMATGSASAPAAATAAPSASAPAASAPPAGGKAIAVAEVNAAGMGGAFSPAMLTVHAGETVEWTNSSGNIHNVTFAGSNMHSPIMYAGEKWSQVFMTPGTYKYTCTYHPGMDGTIVVS